MHAVIQEMGFGGILRLAAKSLDNRVSEMVARQV
jgi:hypothetical protein